LQALPKPDRYVLITAMGNRQRTITDWSHGIP
jgi:hypothetical protein